MTKRELWVEGSFAGELEIEESEWKSYADEAPKGDNEAGDWDERLDESRDHEHSGGSFADEELGQSCDERPGVRNRKLGRRGEGAAARYLEHIGYELLERNYTCPFGEADIIARQGDALVFIEVKTRKGIEKGFPSEAVDARKRAKYEKIAAWYLQDYDAFNVPVRFDVVAIMVIGEDRAFLRHYVNAFGVGF